jgi:TatD DNase family protein
MFELIQTSEIKKIVMHCYSEDTEYAQKLLTYSDEVYFSFSGILTYKNATITQDAAYSIPLNRIIIETDAPFLAPQPVR